LFENLGVTYLSKLRVGERKEKGPTFSPDVEKNGHKSGLLKSKTYASLREPPIPYSGKRNLGWWVLAIYGFRA